MGRVKPILDPSVLTRCSIVRVPRHGGHRWDLRDSEGVTTFAAPDFWTALLEAHRRGYTDAYIEDGDRLYHITVSEWE